MTFNQLSYKTNKITVFWSHHALIHSDHGILYQ